MQKYSETSVKQADDKNKLYKEIRETKNEFPLLSQKRLAEHFNVSVTTIKRALRNGA